MTEKQCYRLTVSYRGTAYCGWQSQPNGRAVQDVIERAVRGLHRDESVRVNGCSRTDMGVHALGQAAAYRAEASPFVKDADLLATLNRKLPRDIVLKTLDRVAVPFRPQREALGKSYTYVINTGAPNAFLSDLVTDAKCLHVSAMEKALSLMEGVHDFSAFTVSSGIQGNCERTLFAARLDRMGDCLCLTFTGSSFLYRMVRRLVGALMAVGAGEREPEWVRDLLSGRADPLDLKTAPPHGLYLMQVYYDRVDPDFKPEALPFLCM